MRESIDLIYKKAFVNVKNIESINSSKLIDKITSHNKSVDGIEANIDAQL